MMKKSDEESGFFCVIGLPVSQAEHCAGLWCSAPSIIMNGG
jgi:hypothetical protein